MLPPLDRIRERTYYASFYGSLRRDSSANKDAEQMTEEFVRTDTLKGFKLVQRKSNYGHDTRRIPVVLRTGNEEDEVVVDIYKVNHDQLILLDEYEGVNAPDWMYDATTTRPSNGRERVRLYVGKQSAPTDTEIPDGDWVRHIKDNGANF